MATRAQHVGGPRPGPGETAAHSVGSTMMHSPEATAMGVLTTAGSAGSRRHESGFTGESEAEVEGEAEAEARGGR
jgi:hypothetical protein